MNTVYIRYMLTGNIFQKINYYNLYDLNDKLKLMIIQHNSDIIMSLLIKNKILNNFDIINKSILLKLNKYNTILVIFSYKKYLYCLNNEYGKYILDYKNDNYSKLLYIIINLYKNNSYDIIINSSYKELVLKAVKYNGEVLEYISIDLQKDKEIVLKGVEQNGMSLAFIDIDLQNDKEIVLAAVKQNGNALCYASSYLQNDKEIVLIAVKRYGYALQYASSNLQDDNEVVIAAVKQYRNALKFASINLQNDKYIILESNK